MENAAFFGAALAVVLILLGWLSTRPSNAGRSRKNRNANSGNDGFTPAPYVWDSDSGDRGRLDHSGDGGGWSGDSGGGGGDGGGGGGGGD